MNSLPSSSESPVGYPNRYIPDEGPGSQKPKRYDDKNNDENKGPNIYSVNSDNVPSH